MTDKNKDKGYWLNIRIDAHTAALIQEVYEFQKAVTFPDNPSRSSIARLLLFRGLERFHAEMTPLESSWLPLVPPAVDQEDWVGDPQR
jgi:hypothetical protein|tara:strand:+ start:748 stop:1011 length:264 start_codon:yes stop_codon:yes gene_type:complete